MPRVSTGPRYYKSKNGWFTTLGGERVRLTTGPKKPTQALAEERYKAEKSAREVEVSGDRNQVYAVLVAYLKHCESRVKTGDLTENTYKMHRTVLVPFNRAHGDRTVRELRPQHVTEWLAAMREPRWNEKLNRATRWNDGTATLARNVLRTALIWAKDEAGLITSHPFDRKGGKVKRQKRRRRRPTGSRVAVTDHEHALLLEQAGRRSHPDFAHLLRFLYATGARPAEMYGARAEEWGETRKAFVIKADPQNHGRYKLAHLGEDRVVYVPSELVPLARELMAKYRQGTLFRNERGRPWNDVLMCARMKSIKAAANREAARRGVPGVRKEVTAYSWRHAFVTRWVKQGKSLTTLCELLNTSEAMLRQHYSHLFEETEALREALDRFMGEEGFPTRDDRPAA